jgi:hypothetical protein
MLIAPVLGALLASWWNVGPVFIVAGIGIVWAAAFYRFRFRMGDLSDQHSLRQTTCLHG